ncbi:MAG: NADH:flavin oxidoreductase [Lachnospiraceae bacterium]|jgi:2,4-dienoyl-CoA reductase-like NADH-dependent reductase (Old Yellow Enzyme family)|nr:NADH:flavin oxidoreductase [Lachnospiraceae bacterium]MDD5849732.1 NADH:flavin oxidoreductase [Bacillota bacterium]
MDNPEDLFAPAQLGKLAVRNHFVRAATAEGAAADDGAPTEAIAARYEALAEGEVGTILTSYAYIAGDEKPQKHELGIWNDALIPAYEELTRRVHERGSRIVMQIVHGSSQSQADPEHAVILGPSAVPNPISGLVPREMTKEEIRQVTLQFVKAAERAKKAGFDGVEIHAAHGYLLAQFLSPLLNHRQDAYGGSVENRARFLVEVVRAVREQVGADYPVWVKINSSDEVPGGLTTEEFLKMGALVDEAGAAAIEISGNRWNAHRPEERLYYLDAARRLRPLVHADVILTGGVRDRADLLRGQEAGIRFFGLARPFLRDPNYLKTLRESVS